MPNESIPVEDQAPASEVIHLYNQINLQALTAYYQLAEEVVEHGVSKEDVVSMESSFPMIEITQKTPLNGFTTMQTPMFAEVAVEGVLNGFVNTLTENRNKQYEAIHQALYDLRDQIKQSRRSRYTPISAQEPDAFAQSFYKSFNTAFDQYLQTHENVVNWHAEAQKGASELTAALVTLSKGLDVILPKLDDEMRQSADKGLDPIQAVAKHQEDIKNILHPLYLISEPFKFQLTDGSTDHPLATTNDLTLDGLKEPPYVGWLEKQTAAMNALVNQDRSEQPIPVQTDILMDLVPSDQIDEFFAAMLDKLDELDKTVKPIYNALIGHGKFINRFSQNMDEVSIDLFQQSMKSYLESYNKIGEVVGYVCDGVVGMTRLALLATNRLDAMRVAAQALAE